MTGTMTTSDFEMGLQWRNTFGCVPLFTLGASIIEKHFTLDRKGGRPDDSFLLESANFLALCRDSKTAWASLGAVNYGRKSIEVDNVQFHCSIYFVSDMCARDIISEDCVRGLRLKYGLAPKFLDDLLGKTVLFDVKAGAAVAKKDIDF